MAGSRKELEKNEHASIRILIVDDHAVLRAGLRMLLDAEADMQVVGEAKDGVEALERTQELTPDVVLLDVTMPQMGGLEALRQIRDDFPQTRVLILTMHDDEGYMREALAAGGAGYVLKRAADIELLTAIRAVYHRAALISTQPTPKFSSRSRRSSRALEQPNPLDPV